jgi:hypothetical protein
MECLVPLLELLFASCVLVTCVPSEQDGTIVGAVFNGSKSGQPVAGSEVILQVQQDGSFIPLAQTSTDECGVFVFDGLPADGATVFLPGANRGGVFYPGERVRLGLQNVRAEVAVRVFDAVNDPSPLVALRHEFTVHTEPTVLSVSETIRVSNPTPYCYVGGSDNAERPVTLRLHIPSNFEKVTFDKEFYGRRFALIDGTLLTTIPWPPGERELKFTYILPLEKKRQVWKRPLDLPCSDIRLTALGIQPADVACNLSPSVIQEAGAVTFESRGNRLEAGHMICLELGGLPVPFTAYARWVALGVLACAILVATFCTLWRSAGVITQRSGRR